MAKRQPQSQASVIDLGEARAQRRLERYQRRIAQVLGSNQHAITELFTSGALFSKEGARAGRDLLLAHQHLLRVVALLDRLADRGEVPAPRHPSHVDSVYRELDLLLERTDALTHRTDHYLARLRGE